MIALALGGAVGVTALALGTLREVVRDRPREAPRSHRPDPLHRPPSAW